MRHLAAALLTTATLAAALPAISPAAAQAVTTTIMSTDGKSAGMTSVVPMAPAAQGAASGEAAAATDIAGAPSAGYVVQGSFALDGTQGYWLDLAPGKAVEVTALPMGDTDPVLTVYDEGGQQIATNDDFGEGLAARLPLHSAAGQRVRVVVSQLGAGEEDAAVDSLGNPPHFTLIVAPATWTATVPQIADTLPYSHADTLAASSRQAFVFAAAAGQSFEATLRATDPESGFDPYLSIVALEPGQSPDLLTGMAEDGNALAEDDDSAGDLDSQLVFTAPAAGRYAAIASGLGEGGGAYAFELAAFIRPEPVAIELDRPTAGIIASRAAPPVYRLSDRAVAALSRRPGLLTITMTKVGEGEDAIDPMLEVGFDTPFGLSTIASDDDSGGDLNAQVVVPVAAGDDLARWLRALRITATVAGGVDAPGAFELTVEREQR